MHNLRKAVRLVIICALAGAVVAAFGIAASQASPKATGSTLTIGWAEPPDNLNPATTGARDVGPILVNVFDTLVWLTPDLKVTPDLATKWSISKDGKTYTFTLRQGVKFHDGTPFNADSIVANIKYITDSATKSNISLALLGPCLTATKVSAYQVQIHCKTAYTPLLVQLGEPYFGIQSPTAIQKYGKDLAVHPIGTGPFRFVSYTPNVNVVLDRNPDYQWAPPALNHNGPASIGKLDFHIVVSSQARISELQSGQSQIIQETPGVFYKTFAKNPAYKVVADTITGLGIWAPINASKFPTNDVAVRRAILYSVDKVSAIKVADNGVFPVSNTPIQKGTTGYDASLENMYPYNPKKAAQILTAAGWKMSGGFWAKNGKRLTLDLTAISSVPEYPLIAQGIQGALRKNGMDAKLRQLAVPAWLAANIKGSFSLTPLQYIAVDPDALHLWYLPKQFFNWSHYTNPALSKLILQGQKQPAGPARIATYKKIQRFVMEQALQMPIHVNQDLLVMSKKLSGVTWSGGGFETFYLATLAG